MALDIFYKNKKLIDDLHEKILNLYNNSERDKDSFLLEDIEKIYEDFLDQYPEEVLICLEFGIFLYEFLHDDIKAIEKLFNVSDQTAYGLLLAAYISFIGCLHKEKEIYEKLEKLHSSDNEVLAIAEYIKSLHYKNDSKEINYLMNAVLYFPHHVNSLNRLGVLLINKGENKQGCDYIEEALKNVNKVWFKDDGNIIMYPEKYIDAQLKGCSVSESSYKRMLKNKAKCENECTTI